MSGSLPFAAWLASANRVLGFRIGELVFGPIETVLLVIAVGMALLSLIELWRIIRRETMQHRLGALRQSVLQRPDAAAAANAPWYQRLGAAIAASPMVGLAEQKKMLAALSAAGIKGRGRLATFVTIKFFTLVIVPSLLWALIEWRGFFVDHTLFRIMPVLGGLVVGWRLPDLVVMRLAAGRTLRLELGMPDALDLLVICAEAGLSLEQAIARIGIDLRRSNRAVADEFAATAAEMRVLPDRREALENLAERTGLSSLRSMIATLNQSIKFGTPLADALRVLAAEMRQARLVRFEERAARLPVLLTIPMMLFILPTLFMVMVGPTVLQVIDTFYK